MGRPELVADLDFIDVAPRQENLTLIAGMPVMVQMALQPCYGLTIHKTQAGHLELIRHQSGQGYIRQPLRFRHNPARNPAKGYPAKSCNQHQYGNPGKRQSGRHTLDLFKLTSSGPLDKAHRARTPRRHLRPGQLPTLRDILQPSTLKVR